MMQNDRPNNYSDKLDEILVMDPNLIFIVVPNNSGDRYATIKKKTCCQRAVPTQVVVQKTMMSKKGKAGLMSIATKIMIQINCKLGGAPWMIKFPIGGVMTVGFDVTRSKCGKKAYGAFIGKL